MFPLSSVLFPHMPLALRVFEQRYLVMLARVLQLDDPDFGVVLIERGQEVGGGERRFSTGVIARIVEITTSNGILELVAEGRERIEVEEWLDDDPHPIADARVLEEFVWHNDLTELFDSTERTVRRTLARASEFTDIAWSPDVTLDDDPVARAWQLAAIAPVATLDQVALVGSDSLRELLEMTSHLCLAFDATLEAVWDADDD
jgi:Lon protease-like protein